MITAEDRKRLVNPLPTRVRARGVRLRGNPVIAPNPAARIDKLYGHHEVNLFNKVRRAGDRGLRLSRLARTAHERWVVRTLVKVRAVRVRDA
jgi:hypothetical protein